MDFFFEPNGVTVVGATPETNSGGLHLLTNLTLGYKDPIYPVNPKREEILGLKCYPRMSDIHGPLDLALISAIKDSKKTYPFLADGSGEKSGTHPNGLGT